MRYDKDRKAVDWMNNFGKSYDLVETELGADYQCYPLFGRIHLTELAVSVLFILGMMLWYRRASVRTRRKTLVGVTVLLLLDEAALLLGMALTGQWNWSYLPLHLCSLSACIIRFSTRIGVRRNSMPSVSPVRHWLCSADLLFK